MCKEVTTPSEETDEVFEYCCTLCHWAVQIMNMSDTANEGDITRILPNMMANIPLFYSHSHLSKYFVECIQYILTVKQSSPHMASRILEGSFVNTRGGPGNSCESDLKTEHNVANRKKMIHMLGANKSDAAIARVTNAADTVADIMSKFDRGVDYGEDRGRHTSALNEQQENTIRDTLRELKPFSKQPGRKCGGYAGIKGVYEKINKQKFSEHFNRTVQRLKARTYVPEIDDYEEDVENEGLPNLP